MKVDSTTSTNLQTLKDGLSRPQQGEATSTGAGASGASGKAAAPQTSTGDANVNLSGLSAHLRSLAASGSADIDTAHVESVRQAIKNGTLTIDSSKIADGVLNTARDLLQNKTPSTGS
ncbi:MULTISPECIES: flagellar biosynthesis anti-sigma factor FlgM [Paraburkholderia]|uniref:flagellar biosynthesis anti-sigma factor FlgM n=1 Tax=Paraburkholderia TaxID=1822464 RepID=UPI0022536868|nr:MULTISPECIES: flagellar biosynthesis anti-sigma factor FlgM [Paraburkholderia]MCX4164765.1 flagellar biosynthesis anti-sigma factor FlgM [Paraburkholderia megapolitana]MDN7160258.1 flagellar biosynthesis anti-sigma factor FlgM [Paraburkholderia sp. CHISQ3]MDQ6497305.1 flagellar biosynthesis anti-sigma factor FlgM [Paraburkholderia megapolitana]